MDLKTYFFIEINDIQNDFKIVEVNEGGGVDLTTGALQESSFLPTGDNLGCGKAIQLQKHPVYLVLKRTLRQPNYFMFRFRWDMRAKIGSQEGYVKQYINKKYYKIILPNTFKGKLSFVSDSLGRNKRGVSEPKK